MGNGKSHFGRRAAVAHSIRSLDTRFGKCTRSADSKGSCEAERVKDEVLYCANERLAHMTGRSRLFLWVLSVFVKVGETTLIRFASVIFEEEESQTQHEAFSAFFQMF